MPPIPHRVNVAFHPGSTAQEVKDEPAWGTGHKHLVGFRNRRNRVPGLTHSGDEREEESDPSEDMEVEKAEEKYDEFRHEARDEKLVNFRDIISVQKDLHLRSDVHSEGWRYVLNASED
jgi:nitrate reductase (NAD(P)H)